MVMDMQLLDEKVCVCLISFYNRFITHSYCFHSPLFQGSSIPGTHSTTSMLGVNLINPFDTLEDKFALMPIKAPPQS